MTVYWPVSLFVSQLGYANTTGQISMKKTVQQMKASGWVIVQLMPGYTFSLLSQCLYHLLQGDNVSGCICLSIYLLSSE